MDTHAVGGIVEIAGEKSKNEDRLLIKALTVEWRASHSAAKAKGGHRGETAEKTCGGIIFMHNDSKANDRIRELLKKGKSLRIARLRLGAAPVPSFCGGDRSYPVFRHELDFIRTRRDAMKLNHLWRKHTDVHSFENAEIEDVKELPGAGGQGKTQSPRWSVTLRFDDHPCESLPSELSQHPTTEHQLVGLCLSGGGIRSATFCLGFIRALFDHGLLRRVDYLSTVSGGGYIGSCMTALLGSDLGNIQTAKKKAGTLWKNENFPFARPIKQHPARGEAGQRPDIGGGGGEGVKEVPAQRKPVEHLRYYSNYLTAEGNFIQKYVGPVTALARGVLFNLLLIAPFLILAAAILAGIYQLPQYRIGQVPVLFHMKTMEEALKQHRNQTNAYEQFVLSASKQFAGLSFSERVKVVKADPLLQPEEKTLTGQLAQTSREIKSQWLAMATVPIAATVVMMLFAYAFMRKGGATLKARFRFSYRLAWMMSAAAVLFFTQLFGAAILYWNQYQVPNNIAWISLLSFLGPKLLEGLTPSKDNADKSWVRMGLSFGLMALAPLILLFFTGSLVHSLLNPGVLDCLGGLTPLLSKWPLTIYSIVILLFLTNHFLNINRISLHEFYRDRLCRAFLIQHNNTQPPREADPFDAIMANDRIRLSEIYEAQNTTGPYHIINATLNQSKSLPHQRQEEGVFRSGESFIFSKYWCGSERTGYADTARYQEKDDHLNLGTAMAISGAAANVGMGRNNLPGMRLLLGLLNVRLGYWALNPKRVEETGLTLEGESPGGVTAIREWFGMYAHENRFINLSDGGHFDNLGVYEMLRRRCKYIIVADAEADPSMKFQGLAAIIRLAWIDFAIRIEIDVSDLRPDRTTHFSKKHCAVGTIHYPKLYESGQEEIGYFVYCKSSLTGTEPQHLHSYRLKNPTFPHQTTADQWYDEEQFEVYRELGYTVGRESIRPAGKIDNTTSMEEAFNDLKQHWYPSPPDMEAHSTRYANELNRIIEIVKNDANVRFMDAQVFPEWKALVGHITEPLDLHLWLPESHDQVRAGFYVCSLMIQLMENVYIDLNLDDTRDHPANRSWMNLFMHWAWSGMFRVTWTILACTFSGEFQRFCERHLHLSLGEIEVDEILKPQDMRFEQDGDGIYRPSPQTKEKLGAHLNPFEIMRIEKLPEDQRMTQAELPERCFAFNLLVKDPLCEKQIKKFTFGFALTNHSGSPAHIGYFRVQDHLRRIGLGRLALGKLIGLLTEELSPLHGEKSKSELLDLITVAERPRKKGEKAEDDAIAESFSLLVASVKTEKKEEYFKTSS